MKEHVLEVYKKLKSFATSSAKHRPIQKYVPHFLHTMDVFETMISEAHNYDLTKVAEAALVSEAISRSYEGKISKMGRIFLSMELCGLSHVVRNLHRLATPLERDIVQISPTSPEVEGIISLYKNGHLTEEDKQSLLLHLIGWEDFWADLLVRRGENVTNEDRKKQAENRRRWGVEDAAL